MSKYTPTFVFSSIYDIDFSKLYAQGKKIIISDLDNTLLPYYETKANDALIDWKKRLNDSGLKLYIITNNNENRILKLQETFNIDGYLTKANKPSPKRLKEYLESNNIKLEETIFLGDQLVTDIACANNLGIHSILVKTIDIKHQKWYTKINRLREKRIIKMMMKENPEIAKAILELKEKA